MPTARAEDATARQVAVFHITEETTEHAAIVREVNRALAKAKGYAVKDLVAVLNSGGEASFRNNIITAQAFVKAGDAAAADGDLATALEQYESAAGLLMTSLAQLENPDELANLYYTWGETAAKSGDKKAAADVFARIALFGMKQADRKLSEAGARLLADAEAAVAKLPLAGIEVSTRPDSAEVYVDGRYRGISPTTVAGLREGEHIVTLAKPGYERKTVLVKASAKVAARAQADLPPARRKLLLDQLVPELTAEVQEAPKTRLGGEGVKKVGALLFADVVVVVRIAGEVAAKTIDLFIFDTATQKLLNHVPTTVDWSFRNKDEIERAIAKLLDFDYAVALGGSTAGPVTTTDDETPVYEQWWLWTIVGAVVVGGVVVGVYFGTKPGEAPPPYGKDGTGAVVLTF
jgi:hypothetical protein